MKRSFNLDNNRWTITKNGLFRNHRLFDSSLKFNSTDKYYVVNNQLVISRKNVLYLVSNTGVMVHYNLR